MSYTILYLKSNRTITDKERKDYLKALWGSCFEHKKGFIQKFNSAIGFAPVFDDICTNYPVVTSAKIKSPAEYSCPAEVLYEGIHIDITRKGIVKFAVEDKKYNHSIEEFSFETSDMIKKFEKYLNKVFPDLVTEVKKVDKYRVNLKNWVLDYFYQNMSLDDTQYTCECSTHRLLTGEEIKYIEEKLKGFYAYPFHINQFWCETCYGYHKKSPYHVEIEYDF